MKQNSTLILGAIALFCLIPAIVRAVPAFPGAEGYGATATGGRGGAVYIVTNLNDSGAGSLRDALDHNTPRTIVFQVSGTIHLTSNLSLKYPNVTIAGQTAPGDGICIANGSLYGGFDNVIIRYIRCRLGDQWPDGTENGDDDATWGRYGNTMIFDHVTASWSIDEAFSYYANNNFTAQWCLISESLRYSHHEKGPHGYGGIWGGTNSSWHHNLLAHHSSRNPRIESGVVDNVDLRNNVIYNWGFNSCYGGENATVNIVNCYYKYGPATGSGVRSRIANPTLQKDDSGAAIVPHVYGQWYVNGNYVYGSAAVTNDNWLGINPEGGDAERSLCQSTTPFPVAATYPVTTQSAQDAYDLVLDNAGCSLVRDSVDTRIIEEVRTGTATYGGTTGEGLGIIDSQETVGGWPALTEETRPSGWDTDADGMPDAWEIANGLDETIAADRNDYTLDADYTNLEVYINSLVDTGGDTTPPAAPTGLTVLTGDATVALDWDDNSEADLAGYYVYRSTTSGSDYVLVSSLLGSSGYTDDTAENGITYFYVVTAADTSSNETDYSDEVFATPVDMEFYRDTNDDQIIDMTDLSAFLAVWLQSDCLVTTGWDINNDCWVNYDELSLFAGHWQSEQTQIITTIEIVASQGKMVQYKNDSGVWASEDRLKTRTAGAWDDDPELNTLDAAKSWLQFDLSGVNGTITSATLTIYAITDAKFYYVNGLNDGVDETWSADTINWFSAPGNNTTSGSALNGSQTVSLYSVNPTTADGAASGDVTSFVTADTDGLVTFILTAGGTTYIYNVIEGDNYNADYVPVLTLDGEFTSN